MPGQDPSNTPGEPLRSPERLDSWKEIAAYLGRDVRTVQRWEKTEGLPVHRHLHGERSAIYAFKPELDTWWSNRAPLDTTSQREEPPPRVTPDAAAGAASTRPIQVPPRFGATRLAWPVVVIALAALAWTVWPRYKADPSLTSIAMVARRVWEGPEVDLMGEPTADGRYVTFRHPATDELAVRDLMMSRNRILTPKISSEDHQEGVQWSIVSPDGKLVAYSCINKERFVDLRLLPPGEEKPSVRVIFRDPEVVYIHPYDWTPSGDGVLALFRNRNGRNRLVLVSVADGSMRVLKEDIGHSRNAYFSPDGTHIAYDLGSGDDNYDRDIYLLAVGNADAVTLLQEPSRDVPIGWTLDGSAVLFTSDRSGTPDIWALAVSKGQPVGAPRLLKKDAGSIRPLGFTRDGSFYYGLPISTSEVFTAQLDPETGRVVGEPAPVPGTQVGFKSAPTWSPDGRFLSYSSQVAPWRERESVICRPLDSGKPREIPTELFALDHLRWTPDNKGLLLVAHETQRESHGIHLIDAATGRTRAIALAPAGHYFRNPVISADQRMLYYRLSRYLAEPAVLMARDLKTGQEHEVSRNVYRFALSPDGRQVAYTLYERPAKMKKLMIAPARGGASREVLQGRLHDIAWMPDGEQILFAETRDIPGGITTDLWLVPAQGGSRRPVGISMPALRDITVHPDGRRIAFASGRHAYEVWVLQDLARYSARPVGGPATISANAR